MNTIPAIIIGPDAGDKKDAICVSDHAGVIIDERTITKHTPQRHCEGEAK